jgi:hypothetical protein
VPRAADHVLMKALTIRQPWAWAILNAGKDVENRSWPTKHRGPLAIHAAKARPTARERARLASMGVTVPDELPVGVVLGTVRVVDCVRRHPSKWGERESWKWVLERPRRLATPKRASGRRMLWEWKGKP